MIQILVIEDSPTDFNILESYIASIKNFDCTLDWAQDFSTAREKFETGKFDLVISDLELPDVSKKKCIEKLTQIITETPIIILSGYAEDDLIDQANHQKIFDYLVKDELSPRMLRRVIRYTLNRYQFLKNQKEAEEKLRQSQKLESIGRLAGGVAHDFNNKLAIISACADVLSKSSNLKDHENKLIANMKQNITRSSKLVQKLLAFGRKQEIEASVLPIRKVVEESVNLCQRAVRRDINLKIELDSFGNHHVKVDENQIDQVIMNLLFNAQEAIEGSDGLIEIKGDTLEISDSAHNLHGVSSGTYACFHVIDNGKGMTEEQLNRAFEPFYTTKTEHGGTGLGLSVVEGILSQHNGFIQISNNTPKGLTASVYLPLAEKELTMSSNDSPNLEKTLPTVLLVEDEPELLQLASILIQQEGYNVITSINGRDALTKFKENQKNISVVVTDVVMPMMDGLQLLKELRELDPKIGVVFVSAYSESRLTAENNKLPDNSRFVPKPFDVDYLAQNISDLLP